MSVQQPVDAPPSIPRRENWKPHKRRARVVSKRFDGGGPIETRECKECRAHFEVPATRDRDFCSDACRQSHLKRRMLRGLAIIDDALRYRGDRKDPTAFGDLCARLSVFLEEDRKIGRSSW